MGTTTLHKETIRKPHSVGTLLDPFLIQDQLKKEKEKDEKRNKNKKNNTNSNYTFQKEEEKEEKEQHQEETSLLEMESEVSNGFVAEKGIYVRPMSAPSSREHSKKRRV